jgi:hypothetical protein
MRLLLAFLLTCGTLFAAAPTVTTAQPQFGPGPDVQTSFDKVSGFPTAVKYKLGTLLQQSYNTLYCVYDFATQGGAVGTVNLLSTDLKTPCTLPGKSVVRNGFLDVSTALVSAGAGTMSVGTGASTTDLLAATGVASLTGQVLLVPRYATVGTFIKLSTANAVVNGVNRNAYQPTVSIASAAFTAGHFRVFIDYVLGE